ncbi:putative E3 ubiquitin ligase [Phytophthora cinnamomi]|uniref:putative E3 ubiquitin ligase n=1 Tax=Phytophthora cinnamomi TaxID=4785 RepID=UPI00355A4ED6|nr:putative E3 ubiquitin ligase [Phytophthora cinnamomi]
MDDDVVDVTRERGGSHEEEEEALGHEGGEQQEEEEEEQEVVELDGHEQKQEESEDDEVQFVGSVEGSNGRQKEENNEEKEEEEEEEDADVVVLETSAPASSGGRSSANTNALMAANGFVTPATLEAELQCIICQYAMFKPVSAVCGHSFCRVCLMDSFLTRSMEEAQCPICRVEILQPFAAKASLAALFPINVTLWNLVQLLIPSVAERISSYQQEEEEDFTHKLDQLDAKWKVFNLNEQAARYHGDHDEEDARSSGRWEEDHEGHDEYPVLKVEDTEDGNLHVSRNIVLDTNDENEDGYVNMRVGIAIVEFPSIFELYNEHQECSVNVIKMEEDEEIADGMPFFMNEDGDDDGFVCSSYYNEISLRVCDEGGNCVMERTRGAQGGVVTFPGLRLDVPGGVYTFRFSDDLYGLKLSITTRLREPHEVSDTPVADYVSLINDEARDANSRNRRRNHDSDNEDDYDDEGDESDDSFIVDDINGEAHNEEPVGRFSDDEEGHWEYHSDDEAADEEREQRRARRQQRTGRRTERDVQFVEQNQEEEFSDEGGEQEPDETEDVNENEEDEEHEEEVQPRRNVRVVVESAFSSDGEGDHEEQDGAEAEEESKEEEEHHEFHEFTRPRRRNANHIVDSEDEDEEAPLGGEEEQKEDVSDGDEDQHDQNDVGYQEDNGGHGPTRGEDEGEDETIARKPTRKVSRSQWFQEDESDDEEKPPQPEVAYSPGREDEVPERPRKRARGRDRQVRIVDEGESDEEQEQFERSIVAANSLHGHNEEDVDEDGGSDSEFRRVHQFYDEEVDERHNFEDAHQDEEDGRDYPDEEEEQYHEEDYY